MGETKCGAAAWGSIGAAGDLTLDVAGDSESKGLGAGVSLPVAPGRIGDEGAGKAAVGRHVARNDQGTIGWGEAEAVGGPYERHLCTRTDRATGQVTDVAGLMGKRHTTAGADKAAD